MRIVTHGVAAVLAFLIGLGVGYYLWGLKAADLTRQIQQQRSEYEYRIAEQEGRAKAAEERAWQEAEARKVFEQELHKVRPLK
ncbi:MAG: hypothetical protein HY803_00940 [candidate division NC10 bacterium]|nr:hypothetical protein [candidate division NC10 bacterium]